MNRALVLVPFKLRKLLPINLLVNIKEPFNPLLNWTSLNVFPRVLQRDGVHVQD
jgi:hypothetical protein